MRWLKVASGFLMHKIRERSHPPPKLLEQGMPAPDFDLPDESGNRRRLKDYTGKKIVLWFYLRASTPG